MKKVKLIIAITLTFILVAGAIGVVFAANENSFNALITGKITNITSNPTAPASGNGIKWNATKGVFEVFNYTGVSIIGQGKQWVNAVGDIKTEATAGYQLAAHTANYNIINDIHFDNSATVYNDFKNTAPNIGGYNNRGGIIDGRGFTFKNFPVRGTLYSGLYSSFNATLRNLNLDFGTVTSAKFHGIFYTSYGVIENCTVKGSGGSGEQSGTYYPFGYTGDREGVIRNCINYFSIDSTGNGTDASGFIKNNYGEITGCINQANIKAVMSAGIVNFLANSSNPNAKVINCTNNGKITAISSILTGTNLNVAAGIAYANTSSNVNFVIKGCVNNGTIESLSTTLGSASGILSVASGTPNVMFTRDVLVDCYNNTNNGTVISGRGADYAFPMYKGVTDGLTKD